MKSFKKQILQQKNLIEGIKSRGYSPDPFSEKIGEICSFDKMGKDDLSYSVSLFPWVDKEFQCSLFVNSLYVTHKFHDLDLFFNVNILPAMNQPKTVLCIDLAWLRCNDVVGRKTESLEYKINSEADAQVFFEDLDMYGDHFFNDMVTPVATADFLLNLKNYPKHIKQGGGPGSVDPYVYAAILYLQAGSKEKCLRTLDLGLAECDVPDPIGYQVHVLENFREKRRRILNSL